MPVLFMFGRSRREDALHSQMAVGLLFESGAFIRECKGFYLRMVFSGESLVSDYDGNIIALADGEEDLVIADVDVKAAADARAKKPYTSLRRTELYE